MLSFLCLIFGLFGRRVLVLFLLGLPLRKHLEPLLELLLKPCTRFEILNARCALPFLRPVLEILAAFCGVLPLVSEVIKPLLLLGKAELREGLVQHNVCQIRGSTIAQRPKPHLLLFFSQLHCRGGLFFFLLLLFFFLLLLGLLLGLLLRLTLGFSSCIGLHGGCTFRCWFLF